MKTLRNSRNSAVQKKQLDSAEGTVLQFQRKVMSCNHATRVINQLKTENIMSKTKTWDIILKAIIAVCSALAGALGAQAMNVL